MQLQQILRALNPFSAWRDDPAKERRLTLESGAAWSTFFGSESYSGKSVNLANAMQLATVFACVRLTAQAIAALPLKIYTRAADGSQVELEDHPLAAILQDEPNLDDTGFEFWEGIVARAVLNGNGYAEKAEVGGYVAALTPIDAQPFRTPAGELRYRVHDRGRDEELPRDKVFHLKGFGLGGDVGLSAIRYGAQTFGTAMATEESVGKMFSNGMQANGVLTSDQVLKKDQRDQLQTIMQRYSGSSNAGKLMILEAGLKYQQLTLNPEDAQMLEERRFNIEEICRWFGMPPIIVGHSAEGQTMWGSGVETILLSWLVTGLNPLATRIEKRIKKQLLPQRDRRRVWAEFNREAMLQMDSKAKAEFLSAMVQNGLMDRNEGRGKLGFAKRAGADVLTAQTNLAPLGQLGQTAPTRAPQT